MQTPFIFLAFVKCCKSVMSTSSCWSPYNPFKHFFLNEHTKIHWMEKNEFCFSYIFFSNFWLWQLNQSLYTERSIEMQKEWNGERNKKLNDHSSNKKTGVLRACFQLFSGFGWLSSLRNEFGSIPNGAYMCECERSVFAFIFDLWLFSHSIP